MSTVERVTIIAYRNVVTGQWCTATGETKTRTTTKKIMEPVEPTSATAKAFHRFVTTRTKP